MSSLELTVNDIELIDIPLSKEEAIEMVAQNMINAGLVTDDYTQAMFDRDTQISTFLGNGIAIPHGTSEKRDSVLNTGLKVLYNRHGIKWDEDDNVAYVIVGIAAKSNEHLTVLRQLTRAVIDETVLDRIKALTSKEELLAILQGH